MAASDQSTDAARLGRTRSRLSKGLCVCLSTTHSRREGRRHTRMRAPAACGEGGHLCLRARSLHRRNEARSIIFLTPYLLPQRPAPREAPANGGGAGASFSNRHYDPRKGAELYHEYLDQMEFADKLGFDGVCLNEHHQTAYGMM